MKRIAILLVSLFMLSSVVHIGEAQVYSDTDVAIVGLSSTDENWTFVEGTIFNVTLSVTSLTSVNATFYAYSYGMELWSQPFALQPGLNTVTAHLLAIYGLQDIVFTGVADNEVIPPVNIGINISPGILLNYTGSNIADPKEGDTLEFYFEIENTITTPVENATLTLYRYPTFGGFGNDETSSDQIEVATINDVDIAVGESVNLTLVWNDAIWGDQIMIVILDRSTDDNPYFVQDLVPVDVEDYEESPIPSVLSFISILLYFPVALFAMMVLNTIVSKKRKR